MRDLYTFNDNFRNYDHVKSDLIIEGSIENPEISIFVPTIGRPETLRTTIDSILLQKGNYNFEIIVVCNDPGEANGSTFELLKSYNDNRIYYYVNKENIGLCGNWNRGLELSRADYVVMVHDDDMLSPWFLQSMFRAIEENGYPDIIGVGYYNFDSTHMPEFTEPNDLQYREVTKRSFFFGRYINIAGMTVKKDTVYKIGGYSDEYYPNEDTNLIYQALIIGRVVNIEHKLAGYRQEVNLSLSENTMFLIITGIENTRRCIAEHEMFADKWMKIFDKEFLYQYVQNANLHWKLEVKYKDVFDHFEICDEPGKVKLRIMRLLLKMERLRS